jgi:predicted RNA-binding Zn-ribbon protein involved in translation (DUF1610 family)
MEVLFRCESCGFVWKPKVDWYESGAIETEEEPCPDCGAKG